MENERAKNVPTSIPIRMYLSSLSLLSPMKPVTLVWDETRSILQLPKFLCSLFLLTIIIHPSIYPHKKNCTLSRQAIWNIIEWNKISMYNYKIALFSHSLPLLQDVRSKVTFNILSTQKMHSKPIHWRNVYCSLSWLDLEWWCLYRMPFYVSLLLLCSSFSLILSMPRFTMFILRKTTCVQHFPCTAIHLKNDDDYVEYVGTAWLWWMSGVK